MYFHINVQKQIQHPPAWNRAGRTAWCIYHLIYHAANISLWALTTLPRGQCLPYWEILEGGCLTHSAEPRGRPAIHWCAWGQGGRAEACDAVWSPGTRGHAVPHTWLSLLAEWPHQNRLSSCLSPSLCRGYIPGLRSTPLLGHSVWLSLRTPGQSWESSWLFAGKEKWSWGK